LLLVYLRLEELVSYGWVSSTGGVATERVLLFAFGKGRVHSEFRSQQGTFLDAAFDNADSVSEACSSGMRIIA
jgi:hypothetical protein